MDLTGIAALVTAAKDLLPALGAGWNGESEGDPTQKRIKEMTAKHYGSLRTEVDDGCMKVLKHLEDGRNCQPKFLVLEVHPIAATLPNTASELLLEEFQYRLEFLQSVGLLDNVRGGRYMISHLGQGYMRVSRDKREYPNILFN